MSFRDNLQHLRATRNMTQEQLAMLLGVSRQSVSKWEAEKAYPEMDKLLKICDIFDCTLDDLVKGDLTEREPQPELSIAPNAQPTDVTGYDEVMLRFAHYLALGVAIIIMGVGFASYFSERPSLFELPKDTLPALILFGGIALGLWLIIPPAFERSAFQHAHPFVEDFYTPEEKIAARTRMGRLVAVGVVCILMGLVMGAAFQADEGRAAVVFCTCVAAGVQRILDGVLVANRVDVEAYNDDALAELSDAEIDALDDPELARKARAKKRENGIYGAIMLVATAVALIWLFCGKAFGLSHSAMAIFWLP